MSSTTTVRIRAFAAADTRRARELWERTEGIGLNESDTDAAIASFLARNPGRVFTRTQILNNIQDEHVLLVEDNPETAVAAALGEIQ